VWQIEGIGAHAEPNRKIGLGFFAYLVDVLIYNPVDLQKDLYVLNCR